MPTLKRMRLFMKDLETVINSGTFVSVTFDKVYKFDSISGLEDVLNSLGDGNHSGDILFDNSNTSFTFSYLDKNVIIGLLDYMKQCKEDSNEEIKENEVKQD
jgi:hypothetical protein